MQTILTIRGMHCASCKKLIESVCKETVGVTSCTVDFDTGKTIINHNEITDIQKMKDEIKSLGEYTIE